jgi:hypothetical protein
MRCQRGQATVEWAGLLLVVALALAALVAVVPSVDGRPLGASLIRAIVCALRADCARGQARLVGAYGEPDARLVRRHAPGIVYEPGALSLPVDYRRCRSHRCSDAPDDRDLDVNRAKRGGAPATAFTHVVRKGGQTYVQYWLYYPDSASTFMGSRGLLRKLGLHDPGFHADDWEGYQVRIDAQGREWVRATAHGHYQWCKHPIPSCRKRWGRATGWTRVSRGSHAGHIPLRTRVRLHGLGTPGLRYEPLRPGAGLRERTTSAPGLRLVPLETLDRDTYRPLPGGVKPPWTKRVYVDPDDGTS